MDYEDHLLAFDAMEEARRRRPRAVQVFDAVFGILDTGRTYLRAWGHVRSLLRKDNSIADLAAQFFLVTGVAHIEAAALQAAKLTEQGKHSLNLSHLLRVAGTDCSQEPFSADQARIESAIESARGRLEEIDAAMGRIKKRRNQHIAHLDQRTLLASSESQAIEVADLSAVFDTADRIAADFVSSCSAFAEVARFSWSSEFAASLVGPEGLDDLVYFTRAGFDDQSIPSPSARVERIRSWDRSLRKAKASMGPGSHLEEEPSSEG